MKVAVFTNQFPGPVCTFFARDMRGLIDAGIDIDVFPIYPLDSRLWRYVPDILNEKILPRSRIHHLAIHEWRRNAKSWTSQKLRLFLENAILIGTSAAGYGLGSLLKSTYVLPKAWTWAHQHGGLYDHVLAYWGNHAATCAYVFHRLCQRAVPFSLFLHANIDLFKESVCIRRKLLYADNVITCSEFNRAFIIARFDDMKDSIIPKLYVHHHGLDLTHLKVNGNGTRPGNLIAVGRLTRQKGFDYLLRAVHVLNRRGVTVKLEFVGDGEEASLLRSLAQQLNITDSVHFRGWLAADDVPAAIRQAMILVHPSPEIGDGVPNVIKEAMAIGTPVIGSDVAGIPELLGKGERGVLVPPKDVNALANAIEALLADDELRQRYAQRAREHSEKTFDLWKNGQQLARFLLSTRRAH